MFRESINPVLGLALTQALVSALQTRPAAALLTTPTLHLFTAGPTNITPNAHPADFTEATFPGYAAFALATHFTGPVNLSTAEGSGLLADNIFLCTGTPSPSQSVLGYWVDDTATGFYLGELFATPVSFVNPADYLEVTIAFFAAFSLNTN